MTPTGRNGTDALRIPLWADLRAVPVNKRLPYLKTAEAEGVSAILLQRGDAHVGRKGISGVIVGADGQLRRAGRRVGRLLDVTDAASQQKAAAAKGIVVVEAKGWRVIPLENLVAARRDRPGTLFALARTQEDVALFATTLETGVHGIVLAPSHPKAIREAAALLRGPAARRPAATKAPAAAQPAATVPRLRAATVKEVSDAGLGDRVCIDTTSAFTEGEGMLVGSTARGFVLVHAETAESQFVRARPFRVNAGALHLYALGPDGRTRYLSELAAGAQVLAVHRSGRTRTVTVGRAKIERRPHTLVRWSAPGAPDGMAVLQTAETVRLVRADGSTVAITDLKAGDAVLVHDEAVARHFGMPVDARLEER